MSVTITAVTTVTDVDTYGLQCCCGEESPVTYPTRAEAETARPTSYDEQVMQIGCTSDYCEPQSVYVKELGDLPPQINMANANARVILGALGIAAEDTLCGSMAAAGMADRFADARTLANAFPGRPTTTDGNLVECGLSPAYVTDRLDQIEPIIEWAAARDREVCWF